METAKTIQETTQLAAIRRGYGVAVRDLRACYNPDGIVAGRLKFNAYWARDGFLAMFGALALGDYGQALAQLQTFMRYQFPSGKLPVRVEFVGHHFTGYNTLRSRPKVVGRAGGVFADPIDPTAFFLIAADRYVAETGDADFAGRFQRSLDAAARWLARHDRDGDGIMESYFLADWMDSILKCNKVFNLNVIYYAALRACAALKLAAGHGADAEAYAAAAAALRGRLQIFWTGTHFSDWLFGRWRGGFSSDGNVLAILFGLAAEGQARRILAYIAEQGLDATTPLRVCHPIYPGWQVFPMYYLAGIADYHRTMIWPWLGTLNALNKARLGDRAAAVADLARIGAWYAGARAVNEVYDAHGVPISRRFYTAEVPFAWNAGAYVHAVRALGLDAG